MRIDREKCVGCRACEIACSAGHTGEFNTNRARIKVAFSHPLPAVPNFCRQCKKAACVKACPTGALKAGNPVALDQQLCTGCGECVAVCPFKAIFIDPVDKVAIKCEACEERWCIRFCPPQALSL